MALKGHVDLGLHVVAFDAIGASDVYHHPDIVVAGMDLSITRHRHRPLDIPFPTMSIQQQGKDDTTIPLQRACDTALSDIK